MNLIPIGRTLLLLFACIMATMEWGKEVGVIVFSVGLALMPVKIGGE